MSTAPLSKRRLIGINVLPLEYLSVSIFVEIGEGRVACGDVELCDYFSLRLITIVRNVCG